MQQGCPHEPCTRCRVQKFLTIRGIKIIESNKAGAELVRVRLKSGSEETIINVPKFCPFLSRVRRNSWWGLGEI